MADPGLDALKALRRLRRIQTDEARRALGVALVEQTTLADLDEAVARDVASARRVTGDFDRDAFSAWLRRMLTERARLAEAMRQAEARTAAAREMLAKQRVAETAAEEALAREMAARESAVARREQVIMEDVARALKRAADGEKA